MFRHTYLVGSYNENKRLTVEVPKMSKMYENEPLLYVEQPEFKKPVSQMQEEYISYSTEEEKTEVNEKQAINGSFKNLSIDEKISYLVDLPKEFIQMKCKVETKNETFRGSIERRFEDKIEFTNAGRQRVTIAINDIESIELIGL